MASRRSWKRYSKSRVAPAERQVPGANLAIAIAGTLVRPSGVIFASGPK